MGTAYAFVYIDEGKEYLKNLVDGIIKNDVLGEGDVDGYGIPKNMTVEPYLIEDVTEGQIKGHIGDIVEFYKNKVHGQDKIYSVIKYLEKTDYNPYDVIPMIRHNSPKPNYVLVADYPDAPNQKTADKLNHIVNDVEYQSGFPKIGCPLSKHGCIIGAISYEDKAGNIYTFDPDYEIYENRYQYDDFNTKIVPEIVTILNRG